MRRYRIVTTQTVVRTAEYFLDAHDGSHARRLFVECGGDGIEPAAISGGDVDRERIDAITDDGPAQGANAPESIDHHHDCTARRIPDADCDTECEDTRAEETAPEPKRDARCEAQGIAVYLYPGDCEMPGWATIVVDTSEACDAGEMHHGSTVPRLRVIIHDGASDYLDPDGDWGSSPVLDCEPVREEPPCPACGNECGTYLGTFGTVDHYHCTACGCTYSVGLDQ